MLQLPSQYGPGVITRVLYDVLKACIDSAYTEKVVYNLIPEGHGKVIVTGELYENSIIGTHGFITIGIRFWKRSMISSKQGIALPSCR